MRPVLLVFQNIHEYCWRNVVSGGRFCSEKVTSRHSILHILGWKMKELSCGFHTIPTSVSTMTGSLKNFLATRGLIAWFSLPKMFSRLIICEQFTGNLFIRVFGSSTGSFVFRLKDSQVLNSFLNFCSSLFFQIII